MDHYVIVVILLSLLFSFEMTVAEDNDSIEPTSSAIRSRNRRWMAYGWGYPYGGYGWPYGGYGGPWGFAGYGGYGYGWPSAYGWPYYGWGK